MISLQRLRWRQNFNFGLERPTPIDGHLTYVIELFLIMDTLKCNLNVTIRTSHEEFVLIPVQQLETNTEFLTEILEICSRRV